MGMPRRSLPIPRRNFHGEYPSTTNLGLELTVDVWQKKVRAARLRCEPSRAARCQDHIEMRFEMITHVNPMVTIPAIQGQFGPRVVTYSTQLPIMSIETILGHDPRSSNWKKLPDDLAYIYTHLQRATTKARLDSILRYIRYRFVERPIVIGAFPAISVAVQNP